MANRVAGRYKENLKRERERERERAEQYGSMLWSLWNKITSEKFLVSVWPKDLQIGACLKLSPKLLILHQWKLSL